jgi:hypothetical protein
LSLFAIAKALTSSTTLDENVEDEDKGDARDGVPSPLVPLTLVVGGSPDTGKQTSDDHQDVGKDSEEGRGRRQTGEDTEGYKEKGSSEQPIDVSYSSALCLDY